MQMKIKSKVTVKFKSDWDEGFIFIFIKGF